LTRWKRVNWFRRLCGRMLKPSRWNSFETELTSSLPGIRASHLVQQEQDRDQKIRDISGRASDGQLSLFDLPCVSLKMSKDTYRLDSPQSSVTWKKMVTAQRGEYSQRLKSAHRTREKESLSWLTINTEDAARTGSMEAWKEYEEDQRTCQARLRNQVHAWPTVTTQDSENLGGGKPVQTEQPTAERHRWPARPGEEQYEWERPRVI